jgi:hypothetical protein
MNSGLSGRGSIAFASGKITADYAIQGKTSSQYERFSGKRFGI